MIARAFSHPEWLPAVAAVVGVGSTLALVGGLRARARLRTLLGHAVPRAGLRADAILVVALAAVGLALLGPRAGHRTERVNISGVDLVMLLDVSRSMDARDAPPSRLERAVRVAGDVLGGLGPGDRAALAAFAGRGVLLTPLTPDAGALGEMLSGFDSELMQSRGSALGAGIREAVTAFQDGSNRPRVLLLLSDGEAPLGQDVRDLGTPEAVRAGVRVVAVGLGTEAGTTVPDHGVPLLDASGRVVISRRDLGRLAALAAATGGEVEPTDGFGGVDTAHLLATLRRDAPSAPGVSVERRVPRLWVWPVAALAFGLLLSETATGFRLGRLRPRRLSPRVAALSGFLLLWLVPAAEPAAPDSSDAAPLAELPGERMSLDELEALVRARPADPLALLRLGLARSHEGLHEDAARAYLAAGLDAHDPAVAALAWYDLGVAELAQGDLAAARDAFFDALALEPHDPRTQFNLEWTLRALAEHPPPSPNMSKKTREPEKRSGDEGSQRGKTKEAAAGKGAQKPLRAASPQDAPPLQAHKADRPGSEPESDASPGGPPPGDAGGAEGNARAPGRAPVLSPEQARSLLSSVTEEPGHAMRQAARRATRTAEPAPGLASGSPPW